MRRYFELNKILPFINLAAFALVVYFLFSFFFNDNNRQPIESSPKPVQTDPGVAQKSSDSLNGDLILKNNIFNSSGDLQTNSPKQVPVTQPVPHITKQLNLRLLGTVAGNEEVACAVIEDVKTKIQDMYKTGDLVQGARIEKIERNRIILFHEGVRETLNLYVASDSAEDAAVSAGKTSTDATGNIPDADVIKVTSPTEREVNKRAFLARIGGIEAILKTVEITPHTVNGKADGLRISGLEGLSMAKFIGLENGDVIRKINGQTVTDNRKAFQVLRKARSLSSLDLELSRDSKEKTMSFKID